MLNNFIKTYADRPYNHTTLVRHKGTVIAFAMDNQRRIYYSLLALSDDNPANNAAPKSPFDVDAWQSSPNELIFSNEIAEVGFGVADQTMLPVFLQNSVLPEAAGTLLPPPEKAEPGKYDYFRSTTARFTADAPFQVLSDGQFVYVFRQAIADPRSLTDANEKAAAFASMVFVDATGNLLTSKDGTEAGLGFVQATDANPKGEFKAATTGTALVNSTLLVDRFLLVGTKLTPKMEVRFQRSRSKTRPANRKDGLDAKDLDGNFFFEPTQELRFVGNLTGGRFTALLLPTQVAEVQRWQIFAENRRTGLMDTFNIERSADGLFNTRGSLADATKGFAESALVFAKASDRLEMKDDAATGKKTVKLGASFTLEAWIKPESSTSTAPLILASGNSISVAIRANTQLQVSFGANTVTSKSIVTPKEWNHVAVTFGEMTKVIKGTPTKIQSCRFFVNGKLRDESIELNGKLPTTASITTFGAAANAFSGTIDELRIWNRPRSQQEFKTDMNQRLTGLEPGLAGYWRLDEAMGDVARDQTGNGADATIKGAQWTRSDAPVVESSGINRSSFQFDGRRLASGPSALLYFQQTKAAAGYDGKEKLLKQRGRVLLAVATKAESEDKNFMAVLDCGVSATGRLAQMPDLIKLDTVKADPINTKPINEQFDDIATKELKLLALKKAFGEVANARVQFFHVLDPARINQLVSSSVGEVSLSDMGAFLAIGGMAAFTQVVPPQLKVTANGNAKKWVIEISDAQIAKLRAAEPGAPQASLALPDIAQRIQTKQAEVDSLKAQLNHGVEVAMPLVHIDALGLTIAGGKLDFAWTKNAPQLFDSANGSVALYFQGVDDQFFVTYYKTETTRARFELKQGVTCVVRSTESKVEKLDISGEEKSEFCTVKITSARLTEVWEKVPREAQGFASVLNGLAGERTFIGSGQIEQDSTGFKLTMPDGVRRELPSGATLLVGDMRVLVSKQSTRLSSSIPLTITADVPKLLPTEKLPVFFLAYDYVTNAHVEDADKARLPIDLSDGSRFLAAIATGDGAVTNQAPAGSVTQTCKWTAAAPGSTIFFDGATQFAQPSTTEQLHKFETPNDLTMEAWVRPVSTNGTARLLHHRSDKAAYTLGLRQTRSALSFDGVDDSVTVAEVGGLATGNTVHTIEAWLRITQLPTARSWPLMFGAPGAGAHHWLLNPDGTTQIGIFAGPQATPSLPLNQWTHLASSFDGTTLRVFVNGELVGSVRGSFNLAATAGKNGLPLTLAQKQVDSEANFAGQIDGVRLWNRARTQAEIKADLYRQLNGSESGLVGCWRFDDGQATDLTTNKKHGTLNGQPTKVAAYSPFAGVNGKFVQAREFLAPEQWEHFAAVFQQAYGLRFDGQSGYLDAGNNDALNLNSDLTIEAFLRADELGGLRGIVSRGRFAQGSEGKVPYALSLDLAGRLVFSFEDEAGQLNSFVSGTAISAGQPAHVSVTRKRQTLTYNLEITKGVEFKVFTFKWDDIRLSVNGKTDLFKYAADDFTRNAIELTQLSKQILPGIKELLQNVKDSISSADISASGALRQGQEALTQAKALLHQAQAELKIAGNKLKDAITALDKVAIDPTKTGAELIAAAKTALDDALKALPSTIEQSLIGFLKSLLSVPQLREVGRNSQALEIGRIQFPHLPPQHFKGIISEVRIWNSARDVVSLGQELQGKESGLIAWWRMEERDGKTTADAVGQSHAAFSGSVQWVKDPDPLRSSLRLYHNGLGPMIADQRPAAEFAVGDKQFTLGALKSGAEHFHGELEETRIWQTARTIEQLQDNLFRRLLGEKEDLIAYYTFDVSPTELSTVGDFSLRGNHLSTLQNPTFVLSTAPISEDTPQVRSALAGIKTGFNGTISSRPSMQEYGDMQKDALGNLIGVFKRCYSFIKGGQWQIITAFKVGDLVTEWIGQVQFAPELIGYIEGAPPVPSENLTTKSVAGIGDVDDYNQASFIELVEAEEVNYTYASSSNYGIDASLEAKLGLVLGFEAEAGFGLIVKTTDIENVIGGHLMYESSWSWLEEASTSVGRKKGKSTSLELRGRFTNPDETAKEQFGRRFIPDNVGQALVKSETADVFALRLRHNGALVSYQMRPNPDIPKDWNIISFPLNPRYVKQGTLDGKVGLQTDVDYPNAMSYSPDSSYFKPIEAYKLKNRITRAEEELRVYFEQYAAGTFDPLEAGMRGAQAIANRGRLVQQLPQLRKRNIVNTYVWTADGGLFAETVETMDAMQEKIGGAYDFKLMAGVFADVTFKIAGLGLKLELDAMIGGHLNLTRDKSTETTNSFALNINLDKVERDIYLRTPKADSAIDTSKDDFALDLRDPLRPKPKKTPGKVDAYRFLSFYLEPDMDNYEAFYERVVDPSWLEQSDDPAAVALRNARQPGKKPPCWRVLHRVTYVSRVLPPLDAAAPPSLEKTLQTLDIDSNYELIKQLEPFVIDRLSNFADFTKAVDDTLARDLPELRPHATEIKEYLSQYFGIADLTDANQSAAPDDPFGQVQERAPNQPPIVNAGPDLTGDLALKLRGATVSVELRDASVIDDRLQKVEDLFVTWEKVSGAGEVAFKDAHVLHTEATFTQPGLYLLRLTASDGQLQASDEVTIVVNAQPTIVVTPLATPTRQLDAKQQPFWELDLIADIATGLGDPADLKNFPAPRLRVLNPTASNVTVPAPLLTTPDKVQAKQHVVYPAIKFTKSGNYLLELSAGESDFNVQMPIIIAVAARVTEELQALYTFEESDGDSVTDVAGHATRLNLSINEASTTTRRVTGGLALRAPTILTTRDSLAELINAMQASNEITLEAWLKPKTANVPGLRRILTCSNGPAARNFTFGQIGKNYYVGLRTTTNNNGTVSTDSNADRKALVAGTTTTADVTQVVCTRDKTGLTVLYLNGKEVGRRIIGGDFSAWDSSFPLALGNEIAANDGHDRAWQGEFHLVALYSRALSAAEVAQNFDFGKASFGDVKLPPLVFAGTEQVLAQPGQLRLQGRLTPDRPAPEMTVNWAQVSGPKSPDGVHFDNVNNPQTSAQFTEPGRYVLRLTANEGDFLVMDEVIVVVQPPPRQVHLALTETSLTRELKSFVTEQLGLAADGLTYRWQQLSGPASLHLSSPEELDSTANFTERGTYQLLLRVQKAGQLWNSIPVVITVHQRPVLDVGPAQLITLPTSKVTLPRVAAVTDNGLGNPQDNLTLEWKVVPENPTVTLRDDASTTTAMFQEGGVYQLRCTATNPHLAVLTTSAEIPITVNQAPLVRIATVAEQPILLRNSFEELKLEATVSDDGLPKAEVALQWSRVNGVGGVTFSDPTAAYTTATFSAAGEYELQLTANDGAAATSDSVTFIVHAPPTVVLTPFISVKRKDGAFLAAMIADTGLANGAPPTVKTTWRKQSGPDGETIFTPEAAATQVSFSINGTYVFEVVVDNGLLKRNATVQVNVRN